MASTSDKPKKRRERQPWLTLPHLPGRSRHIHNRRDCAGLTNNTRELQHITYSHAKAIPKCRWCFPDEIEATLKSRST